MAVESIGTVRLHFVTVGEMEGYIGKITVYVITINVADLIGYIASAYCTGITAHSIGGTGGIEYFGTNCV